MGQDESRATLVVGENYSTAAQLIPLVNCVPLASQAHNVGGGNGALFYYYNPGEVAGDFLGNVFITTQWNVLRYGKLLPHRRDQW